jgi:hypothetical protein
METLDFTISEKQRNNLLILYPNLGKNSDVGKYSIDVVKLFFLSKNKNSKFSVCKGGGDLQIETANGCEQFEVKGTVDEQICFQKLKVSSTDCYNALVNGMTLIRVTSIGQLNMKLHFMKYGVDFVLVPEARWSVKVPKTIS